MSFIIKIARSLAIVKTKNGPDWIGSDWIGMTKGNALAWMRSYLSNQFKYVRAANDCLSKHKLACGVPQGSALGPTLYSMYMAPIADVIRRQSMGFHFYANDTQIYMSINHADAVHQFMHLRHCYETFVTLYYR